VIGLVLLAAALFVHFLTVEYDLKFPEKETEEPKEEDKKEKVLCR